MKRIVAIDVETGAREEIIPEAENVLSGINRVGDYLFAVYLENAQTRVKVYDLSGEFVRDVAFEGIGTASGFGGDRDSTETFYSFSSFATPPSIYRHDLLTGRSTLLRRAAVEIDPADYEVKQLFFSSKDGTLVPMFVTHRRGIELDGSHPTLLYGYGGFNIPLTPSFSVARAAWLELGGVFAMANLRGGGEYGEDWHRAGTKLNKQNVFDDFIAAAETLIREGVRLAADAGHPGRQQRGIAGGRRDDAAAGPVRRGPAGGGRDGHAAISPVHRRPVLGGRLRQRRRSGGVRRPVRLQPVSQPGGRHGLPGHAHHHRGHRRPRRPRPQLQVRRPAPTGPRGRGRRR